MTLFTDSQKAELREMLANPLFQMAFQNALSDVLAHYCGQETMEGAAMAYKAQEGARLIVSTLYANADSKKIVTPTHRRFKTESPIFGTADA